jgi:carbon storage regulator
MVRFHRPTCGQSILVESAGHFRDLANDLLRGVGKVYNSDYQTQHGGSGMLVLSRKAGQVVMVGNVAVTIVRIYGDKVRLGITAPPSVAVDRLEVRQAKESNNNSTTGAGK